MSIVNNVTRLYSIADAFGMRLADIRRVLEYLQHYGYLGNPFTEQLPEVFNKLRTALVAFHDFAGMPLVEVPTQQTLIKMSEPRCGCSDVQRVTAEPARWRKNRLTYFIQSYVAGLSQADQNDLIRLAWNDWQAIADVQLTPTTVQAGADIVISTGRGQGQGFDGPSGTLAFAFLPSGNDQQLLMRFDLDERWMRDNPQGGILFRNVACHEFGHLLGLEHSRVSGALMAPFYSPTIVSPQTNDDVSRIRALYGAATVPTPPPPPVVPPANKVRFTIDVEGKNLTVVNAV